MPQLDFSIWLFNLLMNWTMLILIISTLMKSKNIITKLLSDSVSQKPKTTQTKWPWN